MVRFTTCPGSGAQAPRAFAIAAVTKSVDMPPDPALRLHGAHRKAFLDKQILDTAAALAWHLLYPNRATPPAMSVQALSAFVRERGTSAAATTLLTNLFKASTQWVTTTNALSALAQGASQQQYSLKNVHEAWYSSRCANRSPFVQLAVEWLQLQPQLEVIPEWRESGIISLALAGKLPTKNISPVDTRTLRRRSPVVNSLPLPLWDSKTHHPGGGAPPAQRILYQAICSVPREKRDAGPFHLLPTLRDIIQWLYAGAYNRKRAIRLIRAALEDLESAHYRVPYQTLDYRLVTADAWPTDATPLDQIIPLRVGFPPNSTFGPRVDRERLRKWGARSAPAFRAWIRLAFLWDRAKLRNGGRRVYATRPQVRRTKEGFLLDADEKIILGGEGKYANGRWRFPPGKLPQRNWRHPRAVVIGEEPNPSANVVPELGPRDIVRLHYDDESSYDSKSKYDYRLWTSRQVMGRMHEEKDTVLHKRGRACRILEPRPPGS